MINVIYRIKREGYAKQDQNQQVYEDQSKEAFYFLSSVPFAAFLDTVAVAASAAASLAAAAAAAAAVVAAIAAVIFTVSVREDNFNWKAALMGTPV